MTTRIGCAVSTDNGTYICCIGFSGARAINRSGAGRGTLGTGNSNSYNNDKNGDEFLHGLFYFGVTEYKCCL